METKVAVVLLNLGGPQSLDEVESFLFSLFYDKTILNLPNPLRWLLAKIISKSRKNKAKEIYKLLGGKSPIVEETLLQAKALQEELDLETEKFKVFICMRHSTPNIHQLEKDILEYQPTQIIGIPLYPQFSYTTTHSAVEQIKNTLKDFKVSFIGCFYSSPEFIEAQLELINLALEKTDRSKTIILFSAHSLPVKIIKRGDPYQSQVEKTVNMIMEKIPNVEHKITYQSKVGPVEWLGPNTEHEIQKACNNNQEIIVVPISFVSEHSETLVELDIEYAEIAKETNTKYIRVPTVRTEKKFIDCLKSIVKKSLAGNVDITSIEGKRLCDNKFKYCICK
jgi:ferrochelatase